MRSTGAVLVLAALVAACGAPAISSPTPPASASAPAGSPATGPSGAVAPTRICETAQMDQPAPLTCTEVIGQVLLQMGRDAGSVRAAWFRPGSPCPPNARCIGALPGSAYVVVKLEGGSVGIFNVRFVGEELAIDDPLQPTYDIWPSSGQAVPFAGRPEVGPGAPLEVIDRVALPLCGEEQLGTLEGRAARSCFFGAVQDGRPAEFISRSVDAAGDPIVELYRFAGRGPVLVYRSLTPAGPGWVRNDCAIGAAFDDAQIFIVGECLATELT